MAELLPATLVAIRVYVPSSLYSTAEKVKVRRSEEKPSSAGVDPLAMASSSTVSVEVAPLVLLKVQTMLFGSTRGMSSEMVNCRVTGLPCTPMRSGVTVDTTGTAGERKGEGWRERGREKDGVTEGERERNGRGERRREREREGEGMRVQYRGVKWDNSGSVKKQKSTQKFLPPPPLTDGHQSGRSHCWGLMVVSSNTRVVSSVFL